MQKINSRVGLCIGLLSLHTFSSCTSTKQDMHHFNSFKVPILGATLLSGGMGASIPTDMQPASTPTGLSSTTSIGTTLMPYNASTEASFNATDVKPQLQNLAPEMLNAKRGPYGTTYLMEAAAEGHIADLEYLISHNADLNATDNNGRTALMYAIQNNKFEAVKKIIEWAKKVFGVGSKEYKETLNPGDQDGRTPLMNAIIKDNVEGVKYLLKQDDINLDIKDHLGKTALMYGAEILEPDTYKLLVEKGSDRNAKDHKGKTALMYGIANYPLKKQNIELLIHYKASLDIEDHKGKTALMHVPTKQGISDKDQYDLIGFLVSKGAKVDAQDCAGKTALMHAAMHDQAGSFNALVEKGADLNIKDNEGMTLLIHLIVNFPDATADKFKLNFLENKSFNLEEQDNEGKTALMYAVIYDKPILVSALIEQKANLHAKDYAGKTAYAHAISAGKFEIADFLKQKGANPNE